MPEKVGTAVVAGQSSSIPGTPTVPASPVLAWNRLPGSPLFVCPNSSNTFDTASAASTPLSDAAKDSTQNVTATVQPAILENGPPMTPSRAPTRAQQHQPPMPAGVFEVYLGTSYATRKTPAAHALASRSSAVPAPAVTAHALRQTQTRSTAPTCVSTPLFIQHHTPAVQPPAISPAATSTGPEAHTTVQPGILGNGPPMTPLRPYAVGPCLSDLLAATHAHFQTSQAREAAQQTAALQKTRVRLQQQGLARR